MLDLRIDIFAGENCAPKLLVQALKARCQIHRIAKRRVVHALRRSKIADDGLSNMNAKSCEERLQALGLELSIELFARRFARKRRPASPLDVIRRGLGAFQNTITASPINLSTVPPSARKMSVSAEK